MKKLSKLLIIAITLLSLGGLFYNAPVYADDSSNAIDKCREFLGLKSWDCGVADFDDWKTDTGNIEDEKISINIWIIVANISNDAVVVAAYLVLGYVIYGGYLYIFSAGDAGKTAAGKKTLTQAFIGLAIVLSAKVIVNAIHFALLNESGAFSSQDCIASACIEPNELVTNVIQWVIGVVGFVAVAFVVIGAVTYITSSGDPGKIKKAKDAILYALIGLAIVGLAEVITAFVSSTIKNANESSFVTTNIIAKETTYEK